MSEEALLQTKLIIPLLRPSTVTRPRLEEKLTAGLQGKITLVSAPAGFGKTTLIAEWARSERRVTRNPQTPRSLLSSCWLSLDENDNDQTRFWMYVFAALQPVQPELSEDAIAALQSPQSPPIEALLTNLLNRATTFEDKIIFFLDDYHVIENQDIHQAITFLLGHMPPQMHLVLSTRSDPPLPWRGCAGVSS
jgi:LuxR family maltose regulon positive regulatory protein